MMLLLILCAILSAPGHVFGFVQNNFLIFSELRNLYQVSLAQQSMFKIPVGGPQEGVYTVAFDSAEMKVYWIEIAYLILRRANINGTDKEDVSIACGSPNYPPSIAIDVVSRLVYYTEYTNRVIDVMTLDGRHSFTVVSGVDYGVYSIALYPARGMLYWSEGRGMMAAGMDGSDQFILDRGVRSIFSLTVDPKDDRLYWIYGNTIQSLSIQGKDKRTVAPSVIPYGMALLGQNLYYTMLLNNTGQSHIVKLNISESTSTYQIVSPPLSLPPSTMTAYSHEYKDVGKNNECSHLNGGCEHICVPTPGGRRCACWDGFNVVNETKCFISKYTCPLEYSATRGRIQNPGYPGYQNNMHCQIIVHIQKPGQVIFLKVEQFDLEHDNDVLQIESERWSGTINSGYNYTVNTSETYWRFITDAAITKGGFSITYEIHDVTHCSRSSPCRNGGTCVNSSFCVCPANLKGDRCELVDDDPCRSLPCQNSGQCKSLSSGYTCDCRPGTTGRQCETDKPCASVTCHNGGTCKYIDAGAWCECQPGFTGKFCDTDINECDSSPCRSNGTCEDAMNSYNCICVEGYTGHNCETDINECDSSPCRSNGTCEDAMNSYNCICVEGYTGHNCETDIDECASSPCHNGARCSTSQVDMYTCDCLAGNTGHNCEIDIDECASSPCHNGARCSNSQVDMFSCDCLTGYAGHSCEIDTNTCRSNPCLNEGTCRNWFDAYHCQCVDGFSGDVCEKHTNTCRSDPCLNGGTCRDWFNAFHCQCVDGFSGDVCEKQSKEGSSIFIIAGVAGGGVLIGVVIGIIVCMICRCRKQHSVQEDADGEMSGPRTQPSHTDEKMMSTNFNGANVQDENSAADLVIQQRAIASHYSDTGYEQPVATNPRHTYVNAAMIKREAPTDDYEEM